MKADRLKNALADIAAAADPARKAAKLASLCSGVFRKRGIELVVVGGSAIRRRGTLMLLTLVIATGGSFAGPRGMPAQEGITNFGKVKEGLYRGAEPGTVGITNLVRLRIKTIIDLRLPGKAGKEEAATARANGIVYTNIPMSGIARPKDEQVRKVLGLIEGLPSPIFVHCEYGCDRTGTIIACYRIQRDRWSNEAALREAERYGLSKLERGMRRYIEAFGKAER